MAKAIKYLFDGVRDGCYVRAWKVRREIVVQVWRKKESPDGEPDGDWVMPGILGPECAIAQAVLQTDKR